MPEQPVHWTWLHGTAAPTAEQLEHGHVTQEAREASRARWATVWAELGGS